MGYRRLFIMRKDLNMSAGKLAAQVAHSPDTVSPHAPVQRGGFQHAVPAVSRGGHLSHHALRALCGA